jgi:hypothetical protein
VGFSDASARLVKFESMAHVKNGSRGARYPGYATLSYCWGSESNPGHLLRAENELQFLQALPPSPRTIREAVHICRRIGVRYLWIGAICIIQGQDESSSD